MQVGLNLVYLAPDSGGTGTYARRLIPALLGAEPDLRLTLFTSASEPRDLRHAPWADDVTWVRVSIPGSGGAPWTFFPRTAAQWAAIPWMAARRRIDVVHSLAYVAPVLRGRTASVVSAHDMIWLHDPSAMSRLARLAMRITAPASIRAADAVITGSAHAAADIASSLRIPSERIIVIPHGAGEPADVTATPNEEVRARHGLGARPFVLVVGQRRSHKNLFRLVQAFGRLDVEDARLVFAGAASPDDRELRAAADRAGVRDRTKILGWVEQEDLEGLYSSATCLALPSIDEGFGFTAVEAMARGLPVACSAGSPLADTALDAALLFDPLDVESIATTLNRLLHDAGLRASLADRGRSRAQELSWNASAAATVAVYRRAIEHRA